MKKKSNLGPNIDCLSQVVWFRISYLTFLSLFFLVFIFIYKIDMVSAYSEYTKMSRIEFCT